MNDLENVLNVPERHAAILYGTGGYRLFFAEVRKGISDVAREVDSGIGKRNLRTHGLRTCAGVMYKNGINYVLVHALNDNNLKVLLGAVNPLSIEDAGGKPAEVYLCTPNGWEDYGIVIQETLEKPVPIRPYHRIGHPDITFQSAAIGKDILDVDDGYTPPVRPFVLLIG